VGLVVEKIHQKDHIQHVDPLKHNVLKLKVKCIKRKVPLEFVGKRKLIRSRD
jgi:hypothetical protein